MATVPSLSGLSDDGSYDTSTGPETPDGSPLFHPTNVQDLASKQFVQYLNGTKILDSEASDIDGPTSAIRDLSYPTKPVERICFVGAGYVGMYSRVNIHH